jgi:hypothetical protein
MARRERERFDRGERACTPFICIATKRERERASMLGRESFNTREAKRELFISREINVNDISGNQHRLLMCTCDGPRSFADEISAYKKKSP